MTPIEDETMKLSDDGLKFIANWEGWRANTYADVGGKLTIGYGHLLRPGESYPVPISQAEGLELLRTDAATADAAVNRLVKVDRTQGQHDSLVSFVYNLGEGALAASTLLKLLNAGDYVGASEQFIRWDHVGGIENAGLLNRRKSERSLFLKPDAEDDCPATDPGA